MYDIGSVRKALAHAIYPDQGKENRPLSRMQEEKQAAKEHIREIAESKVLYPSSADGKAEIDKQLNPTPHRLFTDAA